MWIWPSFARSDKLKRNLISIAVIVLAVLLIFVVAPLTAGSLRDVVIAGVGFLAIGLVLRFVPAWLRIRTVRKAEDKIKAVHPEVPTIVANVRVRSGSVSELGTTDYRTLVIGLGGETISFWSPEAISEPILAIPRDRLIATESGAGSPAHLRVTMRAADEVGEPIELAIAIFRARGTMAVSREDLQSFAHTLVAPRA